MAKSFIGRKGERALFDEVLSSGKAELVALYGRRRVGKTFLVRSALDKPHCTFLEVMGTKGGSAAQQRRHFREAIEQVFANGHPLPDFHGWEDGLAYLTEIVRQRATEQPRVPIILFLDELPWLATPKSGLLEALDYQWNRTLSRIPEVKLIVCGSAASWMLRRIVDAKGGLHNRITRRVRLEPFTLAEAHAYLTERHIRLTRSEMLELYMALGGVPYYLSLVERGHSVSETIGQLCFDRAGALKDEFERVFASLFDDHDAHVSILRTLATRKEGVTRAELIDAAGFGSGGSLNRLLQELEEAGFITRIEPYLKKVKSTVFRVIDEFTLFHLKWMARAARGVLARSGAAHWQSTSQTQAYRAWTGYAFESVCFKHAREIEAALGIEKLVTSVATWRFVPRGKADARHGAQIDLLFDRRDGVINVCELKFSSGAYLVTKDDARELKEKIALFERHSKTRKRIILTLVAPDGLKKNTWSEDLIERVVDASAFF